MCYIPDGASMEATQASLKRQMSEGEELGAQNRRDRVAYERRFGCYERNELGYTDRDRERHYQDWLALWSASGD